MRLYKSLAPLACVVAVVQLAQPPAVPTKTVNHRMRILPGPQDAVFAAPGGDANYAYGPSMATINQRTSSLGANAKSIAISVTFGHSPAWPLNALDAFEAAVNVWQQIVAPPLLTPPASIVINVKADFDSNNFAPLQLGSAGPAAVCTAAGGPANTFYAAALANVKNGDNACGALSGGNGPFQITAHFNSSFPNWDFGTSGTPVPGKINFMSVVLHELAHGLGFYGSMESANGIADHSYDAQGSAGFVDVYDRFALIGGTGGSPLLTLASPSTALHAQLTGNNLYFSGPNTNANNAGQPAKIESHDFTAQYGVTSDNGWLQGSSYSHLDDVLYSATPNGLMTWQLATAEVYTDPGPIMRGVLADEGWSVQPPACTFSLSSNGVTIGSTASSGSVSLTTQAGCIWIARSANAAIASISSASSGVGSATIQYDVLGNGSASQRSVSLFIGNQTYAITQNGTAPTVTLDRNLLSFGAVSTGSAFSSVTGPQTIRVTQTGTGTITWTASSNVPWLLVSPASGSGTETFSVSAQFAGGLQSTQVGAITVNFTGAGNTAGPITVTLNTRTAPAAAAPIGSFDTPTDGSTGVSGSIAVTGWALDDTQVTRVTVCRGAITGEAPAADARCGNAAQVYIGDATFIDGARPDIQGLFPGVPLNTRGGWGYLMLTNFLPNLGNGTFVLNAWAYDADGHITSLGSKTITCANSSSVFPFGAIDTPAQGEVISGAYTSFGWVLSPGAAKADGADGGTVQAFVDGVNIGTPGGWAARSDLTALFPATQYSGIGQALAVIGIDSTAFTNGVHTYVWNVTDTAAHSGGIGSRFIGISNGSLTLDPNASPTLNVIAASNVLDVPHPAALRIGASRSSLLAEVDRAPADLTTIEGRRGFDLDRALQTYPVDNGRIDVQAEELDRIELHLSPSTGSHRSGYLRTAAGLMPLPVGSHLDASTGEFTWMPGVGFYGVYDLVFVRWTNGIAASRQNVRITLNAKGSNRVGPQTIIDVPGAGSGVFDAGQPFFVGGWAADLDSAADTGVATVHVWAYAVDRNGARTDPQFLGAAIYGGARPDVAAVYGDRFLNSGYGMIVRDLAPGTYDIAVFALSTVVGNFTPARVVRVIVQ